MKLNNLIKNTLEYLELEKGRSKNTIQSYQKYLKKFEEFTGEDIKVEDIDYKLVKDFRGWMSEEGISSNYQLSILKALRAVLRYANKHDISAMSFAKVELPQKKEREVGFLEKEELEKLLEAPRTLNLKGKRDRAILETLFSTGARVSELTRLKRDDLRSNGSIRIIKGKGGKNRIVFLNERAKKWLDVWERNRKDDSPYLFPVTTRTIERLVRYYGKKAGIKKSIHPHMLRHSLAVRLLDNGVDLYHIKEILGHADIGTTTIYLHASNKKLQEIHTKYATL
jgi:site-specific recombinase XerD